MTESRTRPMILSAASLGAALLALGLVVFALSRSEDPVASATADRLALASELEALRAELAEERQARRMLASEVALLRDVLLEFSGDSSQGAGTAGVGLAGDGAEGALAQASGDAEGSGNAEAAEAAAGPQADEESAARADPEKPIFQLDQLLAAGVDELEAERVREIWYEVELQKLELRDLAIREGWLNSKKFKFRLGRIKRDAVEELGECGYDSLLYGTGRENRVIVRDVLAGSNADRAGIRSGDIILRYNDRRIWLTSDIQAATSRGQLGETVMIDLERNGERLYFRLDRGPLGVFMRQQRVAPEGC